MVKVRKQDLSPTPQAKRVFRLPSDHPLSLVKIVVALFSNAFEGASTEFDTMNFCISLAHRGGRGCKGMCRGGVYRGCVEGRF